MQYWEAFSIPKSEKKVTFYIGEVQREEAWYFKFFLELEI